MKGLQIGEGAGLPESTSNFLSVSQLRHIDDELLKGKQVAVTEAMSLFADVAECTSPRTA
ncbi:hypothetical protein D4M24_12210 [Escherichia coli]|nr:hypothetical protein D4M24_12210 [Escherichia coli]